MTKYRYSRKQIVRIFLEGCSELKRKEIIQKANDNDNFAHCPICKTGLVELVGCPNVECPTNNPKSKKPKIDKDKVLCAISRIIDYCNSHD
jgi:hypothetical protein